MIAEPQIEELKRGYELLDCQHSASPRDIKQSYRRITKRWHPDHYQSGTPAHAEATQMMKLVNEAYAQIANAPLREYARVQDHFRANATNWKQPTPYPPTQPSASHYRPRDPYPNRYENISPEFGRRIDYWTRFVVGAVLGALIALRAVLFSVSWAFRWPPIIGVLASVIFVLVCAFVSAQTAKRSPTRF